MADIVQDFMQRLAQLAPEVPAQTLQRREVGIRQDWGGTEPYVAKRPSVKVKAVKLGEAMQSRQPLSTCFTVAGVSRSTGYRLLRMR